MDGTASSPAEDAWVDLYWIPLGAGDNTHLVQVSGKAYSRLRAWRSGGPPRPLFHSALMVRAGGATHAVEMTPAWGVPDGARGVTGSGPVGARWLGRSRFFRYEVRCWRGGQIPDLAHAVGGPRRMSQDENHAQALLDLVPDFPTLVWGRDELGVHDMWNSNSLISWVLVGSGHDLSEVRSPRDGEAPGWTAGIKAAGLSPYVGPSFDRTVSPG